MTLESKSYVRELDVLPEGPSDFALTLPAEGVSRGAVPTSGARIP
jgi:hypothetical protein